ncbi:hypothetical protein AGOR_G00065810 [Albula goreensis]|uniref:BCL-6 corepressor n=1 Tax=Albula goreensis TaxID=1534307 RepID=A0A8T3DRW3_9TELE|nr:hypothetical protein AGOR_G00065810 [Albula goreensis]
MQSLGPRIHSEPPTYGQPPHHQLHSEHAHSERSHGERSHGERSHGERSHSERSHSERSHSERSHSERSHGERSHGERVHGSSSKSSRAPSSSKASSSVISSLPSDSAPSLLMPSPRTPSRLSQPPAPPTLIDSTLDFPKPLPRGPPSSSSSSSSPLISHPFYMSTIAPELSAPPPAPPPAPPANQKPKSKEGSSEHRGSSSDRKSSKSPLRTPSERPAQQGPAKDPADKPLDLSAKLGDFGAPPNGFSHKLEVLTKLGHSPSTRYGLPPSREILKETLSSSAPLTVSTSSKPPDRPEIISTLHSSWVVPAPGPSPSPSPAHNAETNQNQTPVSSVIKNRNLERVAPQQRSSSCPRIGESNGGPAINPPPTIVIPTGRPASASPSPNINGEWPKSSPGQPEKVPVVSHSSSQPTMGKPTKTPQRPESQEITYKPQQPHLENGHTPSHLYLPQNDPFLPPSLAYANRYLSYSVSDSMSLPHLPLPGKGPVYPHPVLLGSSSLYPAHLAPKHGLAYGLPSSHGEFLTYHDSQEMVHPLMSPHITLNPKAVERQERKPRPQDKPRHPPELADSPRKPDKRSERPETQGSKPPVKPTSAGSQGTTICIDLVQDDGEVSARAGHYPARMADSDKADLGGVNESSGEGAEPELKQLLLSSRATTQRQAEGDESGVLLPAVRRVPALIEGSPCSSSHSPLPDLLEQQTLRCARTSGDRSGEAETRAIHLYAEPCKEAPEDQESHEDEDDDDDDGSHGSSRTWRSSLAKRIANSSGYVGDRFKFVTTELYADSSKLSREQRALQMEVLSQEESIISQPAANRERAMMRFSELELKEKEGGAATGRESADPQQRSESDWEATPHIARLGGAVLCDEMERESVGNNRVPVLQRCGVPRQERDQGRASEEGKPSEDVGSGGGVGARKRTLCPEESQAPRGEEREASWERAVIQAKRSRMSADVWPERDFTPPSKHLLEEVKDLKVCIELTGLSLRTPYPPPLLHPFRDLWAGQVSPERSEVDGDPALRRRLLAAPGWEERAEPRPLEARAGDGVQPCGKRPEANRNRREEARRSGDAEQGPPTAQLSPACREETDTPPAPPPLTPLQLTDKRQRLKDQRRSGGFGLPSPEADVYACRDEDVAAPRLRRHGDPEKPKGKRQCKTKHISLREQQQQAAHSAEECPDPDPAPDQQVCPDQPSRKRSASLSDYDSPAVRPCPPSLCPAAPQAPLQKPLPQPQPSPPPAGNPPPPDTPASRPMPPEARRLIVNKNAGETLLQRAARLGYEEVVLYCLENKVCDVNHRDNAGYCALHEACARGWLSIVQHLVEHGADINCSAQDGTRPLHDAVENDHLDVVRLLLSYGADPTLATYSGRGLLKMTHSDLMESFLSDYFADLQGRADDDPGLCWDFYGSSVCEPKDDPSAFDILADPPEPGPDEEEQREVFEFEFSDRPLLPCYNIQVSLSQGPRNWLLLSDVLKRLRMSPSAFRAAFPHIDVATVAEAEFYRQASLSQLFSCPEELEGFTPDSKDLLDLVEISSELAALLGSSLECLDNRWDSVAMERS